MKKINRAKTFDALFLKLPAHIQKKTEKAITLLMQNMFHPSLHLKKIGGVKDIWEARVDYHYRFSLTIKRDVITLRVIGNHDEVLKNP